MLDYKYYHFKDLPPMSKHRAIGELEMIVVKERLEDITRDAQDELIPIAEFVEATGWENALSTSPEAPRLEVIAEYYRRHKEEIAKRVEQIKNSCLYNEDGSIAWVIMRIGRTRTYNIEELD